MANPFLVIDRLRSRISLGLGAALIGMFADQRLRVHLKPTTFRAIFMAGLLSLGAREIVIAFIR